MRRNAYRFVDQCNEVNCTLMVEEWDAEEADGEATLDADHPAWDIAVEVAEAHKESL